MKRAIFTLLLLACIIVGLHYIYGFEHRFLLLSEQFFTILIPTLIIGYFYNAKKQKLSSFYNLKIPTIFDVILSIIVLFLTPFIVYFVADIFEPFVGAVAVDETLLSEESSIIYLSIWLMLYNFIYTSVMPGVCEEMLFRGLVLNLSRKFLNSSILIVLLNAFLFAAFHENLQQFFYTFALGVILCVLTIVTKSIFTSIFVHTFYNTLANLQDIFDPEKFIFTDIIYYFFSDFINIFTFFISLVLMIFVFLCYKNFTCKTNK